MPILTIIIATYNSEKTIRRALESVLNQIFQEWECIIIDGLSEDGTLNIVKEYAMKDSRFRYISEKDNGIYDAFNKGWRLAKGIWVHYLGSDDNLTKESFSKLTACIEEYPSNIAVVGGNVIRHNRFGKLKVVKSHGFKGCHQGMLTRRNVIESLGGFDEKYKLLADYDLFIRIAESNYNYINIDTIVAEFYSGGASESFKNFKEIFKERYILMKRDPDYPHTISTYLTFTIKDIISFLLSKIMSILYVTRV